MYSRNKNKGFTLIELVVVVAIIGILASIAIPSYQRYVLKSHRVEVRNTMQAIAQELEREYTLKRSYAGYNNTIDHYPLTGQARYQISVNNESQKFEITATPENAQEKDECGTLTLNSQNIRGAGGEKGRGDKVIKCWS